MGSGRRSRDETILVFRSAPICSELLKVLLLSSHRESSRDGRIQGRRSGIQEDLVYFEVKVKAPSQFSGSPSEMN